MADWVFPARWPLFKQSDWNQAVATGRLRRVCLGPMGHTGRKSYLDGTVFVEDGRSYRTVTADAIGALGAQMPGRVEPDLDATTQQIDDPSSSSPSSG